MTLSTEYTQKELSELLKQMLDSSEMDQNGIEFEIIIENEFVRGKLKDHLQKHGVSNEKDIIINYTLKLKQPKKIESHE